MTEEVKAADEWAELERLAKRADPSLTNGRASAKVMAQTIRDGNAAQRPRFTGPVTPDDDAAYIIAACLAVPKLISALRQKDEDAVRFRALMRCGRIKMQGSSGVDPHTLERNGNGVHFGAEFWPAPPKPEYAHLDGGEKSTRWGRACLRHLADAILEHEAAALTRTPDQ